MFHRLVLLPLLAALVPLRAQNVYVDSALGNDANAGTPSAPLKSIGAGLARAGNGSTVFVYAGAYGPTFSGETLPLKIGATLQHNGLVLRGLGKVVLDCNGVGGTAIQVGRFANGGRITNFTFTNMGSTDWWGMVVAAGSYKGVGSATGFEIDRCVFDSVNRGVVIWENSPPVTGWLVHDNLFKALSNDAVNEFFSGSANQLFNNTIVGTPHLGILTEGTASSIANNLVTGCRIGVSAGAMQTAASFATNDVWNCQTAWQGIAAPPGSLAVDPLFASAATGDYRLQAGTPLLDAGTSTPYARADLDGNSGEIDSNLDTGIAPEIGAYELSPVVVNASYSGGTLSASVTAPATLPVGILGFALDDGVIRIPGWSPILLDPATLLLLISGPTPFTFTAPGLALPRGQPLVVQGFAWNPALGGPVPGRQVWLQL